MRSIAEVTKGSGLSPDDYRICFEFWIEVRGLQGSGIFGNNRHRWLVGSAMANRRVLGVETDFATIQEFTGIPPSSLKKTINQMVTDGFLVKERDPADKRRILIKPTKVYTDNSLKLYVNTIKLIRNTCTKLKTQE